VVCKMHARGATFASSHAREVTLLLERASQQNWKLDTLSLGEAKWLFWSHFNACPALGIKKLLVAIDVTLLAQVVHGTKPAANQAEDQQNDHCHNARAHARLWHWLRSCSQQRPESVGVDDVEVNIFCQVKLAIDLRGWDHLPVDHGTADAHHLQTKAGNIGAGRAFVSAGGHTN